MTRRISATGSCNTYTTRIAATFAAGRLRHEDRRHPSVARCLADEAHFDAAHCDFWRAAPTGRMFLIRGYQEDSQETFAPATIFDTGLPIWRLGEALLHAARLAALLKQEESSTITIRFRVLYTGLTGRVLKAWANPLIDLLAEGGAARSDEAMLETVVPASAVEKDLASAVFPLIASLYERFGVTGLSLDRVRAEVERLQNSRIARHDR